MIVRDYGSADREALIEQFQSLNRHENAITGDRRIDRQGGIDALDAALNRVRDTAGLALIAERDGQILGHLFVAVEDDAQFVREELRSHAHITEFFVREVARGGGVGRALLARAERFAAARGLVRLTVSALSGNLIALAAYQRFGFSPHSVDLTKAVSVAARHLP
jgi:GNAT superfamily N-acetyltransferase